MNLPKLDLNITNRCNYRCKHCAFDSGLVKMNELSLTRIKKILTDTKELGGKRFDITGGEPLVRKDVEEIIIIGKKLGYNIELVTNGSLLTTRRLIKFKKLGLDKVAISLDGSTAKKYNFIRRRDRKTFNKVLKNIREAKRIGFYTKINTTVFSTNIEDIKNITNLAIKLNADELGLYYFTPVGRGYRNKELVLDPIKWLEFLKNYSEKRIKISLEFPIIKKEFYKKELGCIANQERSHLQILPDGNVYPCAILASYQKPVANLNECSVKDIWNNKRLWKNYWNSLKPLFKQCKGYCVNISKKPGYKFICPLRKFELGGLKCL